MSYLSKMKRFTTSRSNTTIKKQGKKWLTGNNKTEAQEIAKKNGVRYSELARLPYFNLQRMKLVKEAITYINPGQTPVIGMDQPLYALAKQIQWERAETYGESSYVVMMGGLHIEKASLKMVGHWLTNSGWDSALVQADITSRGRADAILKAVHITRSRSAHQVSACALYILQQ